MGDLMMVKHAAPEIVEDLSPSELTLSRAGRQECQRLAERISEYSPGALLSSEEPKARQTARIIGSPLGLVNMARPGLQENDRTGLPFSPDEAEFKERMRAFFFRSTKRSSATFASFVVLETPSLALREIARP